VHKKQSEIYVTGLFVILQIQVYINIFGEVFLNPSYDEEEKIYQNNAQNSNIK